jgi:hypothetical protein
MTYLAHPSAGLGAIHPAIDHAPAAFPPADARLAAAVIRHACGGRIASADPDAWKGSRLTGDGFPFELGFATSDARLRFTVEPGTRTTAQHARLANAATVAAMVGGVVAAPQALEGLRAMQEKAALAYGAWLGCRIGPGGADCKLYVEVPPGAPFRVESLVLEGREVTPRMVACDLASGAIEAYCRVRSLEPRHLPAVLASIGAEARAPDVFHFIEEAYGHRIRERLPGPSIGVSFVRNEARPRVTLHFYARSLWGSDGGIRRGFSRVAQGTGWDDRAYQGVTEPLANRDEWRTYHGLFGLTVDASPNLALSIGVRPMAP